MSNTSNQKAEKGSKYWMQEIVNNKYLREELENKLGVKSLEWISPLENESYDEYKLTEEKLKEKIPSLKEVDFSFWPKNGPEWDAIALSEDGSELYLFEAKSHLTEMYKETGAGADSLKVISKCMQETCTKLFGSESKYNKEIWEKSEVKDKKKNPSFYQLGNRLTFLYYLNERRYVTKLSKSIKVKLVLLNIVNDYTHNDENKMIPRGKWEEHYKKVFYMMKYGNNSEEKLEEIKIPENVEIIYFEPSWKYNRSELLEE